jgi:hypothetical protein
MMAEQPMGADFALTFDVPHQLGVSLAADRLRRAVELPLQYIESQVAGTIDIPGPGVIEITVTTKITDGGVHVIAEGDKPFHVFDKWIKDAILKKLKENL